MQAWRCLSSAVGRGGVRRLASALPGTRNLDVLEKSLGYTFRNKGLLAQALVHRSHAQEQEQVEGGVKVESNERLEFLGDSVIGLVSAELAYMHYGHTDEGVLTNVKKLATSNLALVEVATQLGLAAYLQTSALFAAQVAGNVNHVAAPKVFATGPSS